MHGTLYLLSQVALFVGNCMVFAAAIVLLCRIVENFEPVQ